MNDAAVGPAELLGLWAVDHGFHSVMEDELIVFRPDGSGWCEYQRPWYRVRTNFRWRLAGDALLHVKANLEVVTDEHASPPQREHAIDVDETVRVAITVGTRPLLEHPVRELSVELSFNLGAPFAFVAAEESALDA
ncbi:hypothetical protein AB0F72_41835 [Actinoplanes sp. NPDC023936]|uniref:hypothetical protein n=1 Tax=Actinoplanes sp. NPDC023936 TaxID=3154910 RepID=UPI0033F437CF